MKMRKSSLFATLVAVFASPGPCGTGTNMSFAFGSKSKRAKKHPRPRDDKRDRHTGRILSA